MAVQSLFRITVEQCIDDTDQWVWSLIPRYTPENGAYMDGYATTEAEAWQAAREARREVEADFEQDR